MSAPGTPHHKPHNPGFLALVADAKTRVREIDIEQFQRMREAGQEFLLVDVRGRNERAIAGIAGAQAIHLDEFRSGAAVPKISFDQPVVVLCKVGLRSEEAARILIEAGHPDVRSLQGGVLAWVDDVDPAQPRY